MHGEREAEDPTLRVSISVRRERLPRPGPTRASWQWDDVLASAPPPGTRAPREGTFVVRHGFDAHDPDPEVRLGYASVVTADPRHDARPAVRVQERVTVEARVFGPVLAMERAMERRVGATTRRGATFVTQGSHALAQRVGGRGGQVLVRSTDATVSAGEWVARTLRDTVHAVVQAPDRLWSSAASADAHLAHGYTRRALLKGFWNPHALSREGKAAALFLLAGTIAFALLAGTLFVALAHPADAAAWRAVLGLFVMGVASTLLFPFFPEFQLIPVAGALEGHVAAPGVVAILTITLAMTLGGWMVLFLGDEIHGALRRNVKPGSGLARGLDRAEAFAEKNGFWLAFGVLAIPLGPDTPVFYTLATVRTPVKKYVAGCFLGLLVRFSLWFGVFSRYYVT